MATVDEEFKNRLNGAINAIMPTIIAELIEMKRSYFSEQGKPGWKPLAEKTIANKLRGAPKYNKKVSGTLRPTVGWNISNAEKFNTQYGFLKNSIKVDYTLHQDELTITVEAHHREGDQAIEQLIDGYGRDFLRFDTKEIEFIKKRLGELLADKF